MYTHKVLRLQDVSQHTKYSTEVESEDERWVYDWDKYDRDKDQSSDVVDSDDKEGDTFAKRKGVSPLKKGMDFKFMPTNGKVCMLFFYQTNTTYTLTRCDSNPRLLWEASYQPCCASFLF